MKTYVYLWSNFAEFLLEREIFQKKVLEKIKIHTLCSINFLRISHRLRDNVKMYSRARQATGDKIIRRRKYAIYLLNN
jgi:hypothetical protein